LPASALWRPPLRHGYELTAVQKSAQRPPRMSFLSKSLT
jgi:hypothetical protein